MSARKCCGALVYSTEMNRFDIRFDIDDYYSIAILKNGDQLPISRSHLQEVKRQINQFWGAHI